MKVYYFGCIGEAGHYMHTPNEASHDWDFMEKNPWGLGLDDGFKGLRHKDGWTALAMTDYTVDSRPGSNSVFLAEGTFSQEEMNALAHQYFPSVAKRIGLPQ
jgi:hypothetical protein